MADKSRKRARGAARGRAAASEHPVKLRTDPRSELRFAPASSTTSLVTWVGLGVGAALAGAGVYAQWLRPEDLGPHAYARYLLAGAAALAGGTLVFGPKPPMPVRVGDAGIGLEKASGEVERIAWNE